MIYAAFGQSSAHAFVGNDNGENGEKYHHQNQQKKQKQINP